MNEIKRIVILCCIVLPFLQLAHSESYSDLWGKRGELWDVNGRLPDFSFAGFRQGNADPPNMPTLTNVKNFGAKGDGIHDDTKAIQKAIDETEYGAILVPSGTYKITDIIKIKKPNVILRGESRDQSVLWFPQPLNEIHPKSASSSSGRVVTAYAWDYGFITLDGDFGNKSLCKITAPAARGQNWILISHSKCVRSGTLVNIRLNEDSDNSLKTALYTGEPGDISNARGNDTRMVVRILKKKGRRLILDRPLKFDIKMKWSPEILEFNPRVYNSGIEKLTLLFPDVIYPGHFNEQGYNGIELREVTNCWVKNVRIHNADMGLLFAENSTFNSAYEIVLTAFEDRGVYSGHHGMQFKNSRDNVITDFEVNTKFVHDLSVESSSGNVYSRGRGVDLNFDHHKDSPYANLYTNIHCGLGTRIWKSGGGQGRGLNCAGWGTFWNIRASRPVEPPPIEWGPNSINFVGLVGWDPSTSVVEWEWVEAFPEDDLYPKNLLFAQRNEKSGSNWLIRKNGRILNKFLSLSLMEKHRGYLRIQTSSDNSKKNSAFSVNGVRLR